MQDVDRATAEDAVDGGQQVARVGGFQLAVEDQVGEQDAVGLEHAARAFPEFAGDEVAGNRGVRAVDVDDDGVEAALAGGDEAAGVVGDEFAARRFAQEVLFGDVLDCRVDVDVGVAVARLAVRQRETAGAEDEDVAVAECQFVEQDLAQALDVARVVGRLGIVDQRGRRTC